MGELTPREKIIKEYHDSVEPLLSYLPWLSQHAGETGETLYGEQGISEHSLSFPVYDATLLRFVREAGKSSLMDRNYRYVYSRNHLKTHEDEKALIAKTSWRSWDQLKGILSCYVLGGRVKATLWSEGVKARVYLMVLEKMRDIARDMENAQGLDNALLIEAARNAEALRDEKGPQAQEGLQDAKAPEAL